MSDNLQPLTTPRALPSEGYLSATQAFNGTIVSSAICAGFELGLLSEIHEKGVIDRREFGVRHGLDAQALDAILMGLRHAAIVEEESLTSSSSRVLPGEAFDDAWKNKGYFLWLLGGYGSMLAHAAQVCRNVGQDDPQFARDGGAIARAGRDYGGQHVDPHFDALVDSLGFSVAVDLGCGSAGRLISLAHRHPAARFVGVDIDAQAVREARATVAAQGLAHRIEIVQADISDLSLEAMPDVDLVFSFFMAHDLLPEERMLGVLHGLRTTFPNVGTLLLADTCRSATASRSSEPIFTLGFSYTHGLMRQRIPTLAEWKDLFVDSDWDLHATHQLGIADSVVFHLRPAH